jgi:hypothetical protein
MKKAPTITEAAEEVLMRNGHPLHYKVLTEEIHHCSLTGKTPSESVRSRLATSPKFKRVAEGVFGLVGWSEYSPVRFAKDIAYDILKKTGRPLNIDDLGRAIILERKFSSDPKVVVRNSIRSDRRFYYDSAKKLIGLVEWIE